MKNYLIVVTGMLAIFLTACGGDVGQIQIPDQHWKDMAVRIDTHPNPPIAGMSEIVAIVTGPHGRPISNLTVSWRSNESMPWVQAIQDGRIGVYRRAVDLGGGDVVVLQVRLQQGEEQKVLLFPLKLTKD
ncbi:MAG: hypothetical protein WC216_00885 [Gallionella sp.]|jgi:hypothetical protein